MPPLELPLEQVVPPQSFMTVENVESAANPELAASVGSAAVGWARKNPEAAGKIARSAVV